MKDLRNFRETIFRKLERRPRMFVLKRNQIIITALVVMIAVAGYLNYMDGRTPGSPGLTYNEGNNEIAAIIPDDDFFFADIDFSDIDLSEIGFGVTQDHNPAIAVSAGTAPGTENEPGEAVFVTTTSEASFFVQARLNREQSRAAEQDILTGLINNNNVGADQRAQAADNMINIQRRIERESAAESMIEAKGFSEVYVRIGENSVDVVVAKEVLTDAEVAQIEDIIKRKTGMQTNQIHISPMRR